MQSPPQSIPTRQLPPLIIVQGFLSPASDWIWGSTFQDLFSKGEQAFRNQLPSDHKRRKIIFAPLGPCSSLHDRACELFYVLKGGRIDYGKEHSQRHGHSRFGRFYPKSSALLPEFDSDHPAHFLGHSLGGATLCKLQELLKEGFFDHALTQEHDGEKKMADEAILSITSISSPFHGTPLVYLLGSQPVPYPSVRFFSVGNLLSKAVHILAFVDGFAHPKISSTTRKVLDVYADAWHFSQSQSKKEDLEELANSIEEKGGEERLSEEFNRSGGKGKSSSIRSLSNFLRGSQVLLQQLWKSDWAEGEDCAPWECTLFERERNPLQQSQRIGNASHSPSKCNPLSSKANEKTKTWYRSYSSFMTTSVKSEESTSSDISSSWHQVSISKTPLHLLLSPLAFTSNLIGRYDYSKLDPLPSFLKTSDLSSDDMPSTFLSQASEALRKNEAKTKKKWQQPDSAYHSDSSSPSLPSTPSSGSPLNDSFLRSEDSFLKSPERGSNAKPTLSDSISSSSPHSTSPSSSTSFNMLESWFANDGVVPLASQYHPGLCSRETCTHSLGLPCPIEQDETSSSLSSAASNRFRIPSIISSRLKNLPYFSNSNSTQILGSRQESIPEANRWHVVHLPETSHTSLAPVWTGSEKQRIFWVGLGEWIAAVDEASERDGR